MSSKDEIKQRICSARRSIRETVLVVVAFALASASGVLAFFVVRSFDELTGFSFGAALASLTAFGLSSQALRRFWRIP